MEMQEFITIIVNNGTAVAIIAYFMYRDFKFMSTLRDTLTTLVDTVDVLKDAIIASKPAKTE